MRTETLQKRVAALETTQSRVSDDQWPPRGCDPIRRLAKHASYFDGRPWECTGTPERKAQRDARLARYRDYFENLETGGTSQEWQ